MTYKCKKCNCIYSKEEVKTIVGITAVFCPVCDGPCFDEEELSAGKGSYFKKTTMGGNIWFLLLIFSLSVYVYIRFLPNREKGITENDAKAMEYLTQDKADPTEWIKSKKNRVAGISDKRKFYKLVKILHKEEVDEISLHNIEKKENISVARHMVIKLPEEQQMREKCFTVINKYLSSIRLPQKQDNLIDHYLILAFDEKDQTPTTLMMK